MSYIQLEVQHDGKEYQKSVINEVSKQGTKSADLTQTNEGALLEFS